MIRLLKGDILSFARHYKGPRFHAILCDPPYHLGESGFMNKDWDAASYGISFNPETWAALGEHLLPGAFGFAFASSRGWHRLAVAIEDAGMRIHPSIFGWAYGSGFPKATRIDTQIDQRGGLPVSHTEIAQAIKQAREKRGLTASECDKRFCNGTTNWTWYEGRPRGINIPDGETFRQIANAWPELESYAKAVEAAEREVVGKSDHKSGIGQGTQGHYTVGGTIAAEFDITLPATELAQTWQHHRYGLQAIKPALEPIIVFQKPYSGKPVDSIVATGAGAINIDASRIGLNGETPPTGSGSRDSWREMEGRTDRQVWNGENSTPNQGRWPANFTLSHHPLCERITTTIPCPDCHGEPYHYHTKSSQRWLIPEQVTCHDCGFPWHIREPGGVTRFTLGEFVERDDGITVIDGAELKCANCGERMEVEFEQVEDGDVEWRITCSTCNGRGCVQVGTREVKGGSGWSKSGSNESENLAMSGKNYTRPPKPDTFADENGNETIANWRCHESCPVRRLGEMSGESKSTNRSRYNRGNEAQGNSHIDYGEYGPCVSRGYDGVGTAARFFFQSDWHHEIAERLAQADPVRYQAKASRRERDAGLQGMPTLTVDELSGGGGHSQEYQTKYQARKSPRRNPHPTLKPIELCRWLATLLLPPDAYAPRRILVPFAGTASEMIGAGLAGWEHIVGIELSMENVLIGEARLNHWLYQPQQGALL